MKNIEVKSRLNKATEKFKTDRRMPVRQFLDEIVEAMEIEGGISGFKVTPQKTVLANHSNLPCLVRCPPFILTPNHLHKLPSREFHTAKKLTVGK